MALIAEWQAALARFHFERPAWLLAVPLLLALAAWLARRSAYGSGWSSLVDAPLLEALRLPESGMVTRASPWPWLALAWTLAVLALAGPTWQREPAAANSSPDGWVLVLDLSPSMLAPDAAPNRVTRARYAIEDVLRAAQGARVGLVVFSAEPFTVSPLTDDVATVRGLTGPLAPGLMPSAGDKLGPALVMAQQLLEGSSTRGGHVVVLTDGYADPLDATAAAQSLRERSTTVDVLAIGGKGTAALPGSNPPTPPTQATEGDGTAAADVLAPTEPVDRALLQQLARAGGGRVFGLDEMPALLTQLQTQVPRSATTLTGVEAVRWRDAGVWLLPPLLLLVALLARRGWW
jgi:Ca-activated chloride channel family protein